MRWKDAEVVKFLPGEEPDAIEDIRKLVKKRKERSVNQRIEPKC